MTMYLALSIDAISTEGAQAKLDADNKEAHDLKRRDFEDNNVIFRM